MRISLYLDEDSHSSSLVQALRSRGVDVITTLEAGMLERGDQEQLEWATAQGRVVYSFNIGHFYHLHTAFLGKGNRTPESFSRSNSVTPSVNRCAGC
jgi:hypothetical protein